MARFKCDLILTTWIDCRLCWCQTRKMAMVRTIGRQRRVIIITRLLRRDEQWRLHRVNLLTTWLTRCLWDRTATRRKLKHECDNRYVMFLNQFVSVSVQSFQQLQCLLRYFQRTFVHAFKSTFYQRGVFMFRDELTYVNCSTYLMMNSAVVIRQNCRHYCSVFDWLVVLVSKYLIY